LLPRDFYRRASVVVAPELLNKLMVTADGRMGRIVETEAYHSADAASHSFRGVTARTEVMFGPPGHLYVYFTYGMHWCCNPVCGAEGDGQAVLIRALEPLAGLDAMRAARGPAVRRDRDLCNGPAKLCQALRIAKAQNGIDLVTGEEGLWLADDGTPPPARPANGVRIGTTAAADAPLRWWVPDHPAVSKVPRGR
jgi:DNA-3-methyladenine glycosylase